MVTIADLERKLESEKTAGSDLGSKASESDSVLASLKEEHSSARNALKEELTQTAAEMKARVIEMERSSAEAKLT